MKAGREQQPAQRAEDTNEVARRATGFGRLLVAVYGVFALSATARAGYQIATKFDEAPVAYLLSAFAAVVYILATITLAKSGIRSYWLSVAAVGVELLGVVAVGLLSLLDPELLPQDTVWSGFGQGYGYIPLVLPVVGLWWLWRHRPAAGQKPSEDRP